GFVGASIAFSLLAARSAEGAALAAAATESSKTLRGWCFCLAFVSIGLETNFRALRRMLVGGKPLVLYLCGQSLNLALTLAMAWLMFVKVFPHAAETLSK
ncbi:MAG TPA: putative sulfate exporter family transporter, partial [Lacipirellulaceae bacterium]|nr:putative sulfate exporter family transporter [Lacipirellulaceae bacterium]